MLRTLAHHSSDASEQPRGLSLRGGRRRSGLRALHPRRRVRRRVRSRSRVRPGGRAGGCWHACTVPSTVARTRCVGDPSPRPRSTTSRPFIFVPVATEGFVRFEEDSEKSHARVHPDRIVSIARRFFSVFPRQSRFSCFLHGDPFLSASTCLVRPGIPSQFLSTHLRIVCGSCCSRLCRHHVWDPSRMCVCVSVPTVHVRSGTRGEEKKRGEEKGRREGKKGRREGEKGNPPSCVCGGERGRVLRPRLRLDPRRNGGVRRGRILVGSRGCDGQGGRSLLPRGRGDWETGHTKPREFILPRRSDGDGHGDHDTTAAVSIQDCACEQGSATCLVSIQHPLARTPHGAVSDEIR